jgi:uncharacterized protein
MIHAYKLNGHNIIIDAASGSVHAVDDVAYDAITMYEARGATATAAALLDKYADEVTPGEIDELFCDIQSLIDKGQLFTEDAFEELADAMTSGREVKALCLHVAHTCNMTREYCFARQGRYQGERALMSIETGQKAIDFLITNSGTRRNLEVDFFGGEPLMNWAVVKGIVAYARSVEAEHRKNFRFTLTTNGLLIDDEVIAFANREMANIVLSLDGRRAVHDARRRTADGRGTYDAILPKFRRLVEARGGKNYYIRGTYTRENSDFAADVLHMADLGFTELSMEPVVAADGAPYALTAADLPKLAEQYELLAAEMINRREQGRGFTFYHYMLDLEGGPCVYKRVAGCGSGTEYLAVTPWGELFPCHQFVVEASYSMGTLDTGVTNEAARARFASTSIYARKQCRVCWARLYCAGGCSANAYHSSGDVGGVYELGCELFKKRMECAIMLQAARRN